MVFTSGPVHSFTKMITHLDVPTFDDLGKAVAVGVN
jgi:hypothetical protein